MVLTTGSLFLRSHLTAVAGSLKIFCCDWLELPEKGFDADLKDESCPGLAAAAPNKLDELRLPGFPNRLVDADSDGGWPRSGIGGIPNNPLPG